MSKVESKMLKAYWDELCDSGPEIVEPEVFLKSARMESA